MQKWEYKKIWRELDLSKVNPMELSPFSGHSFIWKDIDENDTKKHADEMRRLRLLGNEGWELVSVLYEQNDRKFTYTHYLKRSIE